MFSCNMCWMFCAEPVEGAHEILVTAQRPNSPFPFGFDWDWNLAWGVIFDDKN